MRVIISGDRNWTNESVIKKVIDSLPEDTVIVEGDCSGADRIAGELAKARGLKIEVYAAKWNLYGKGAGPIRNYEMLATNPDIVYAFHNDIKTSKGTKHMISIAEKNKVPVVLITEKDGFR